MECKVLFIRIHHFHQHDWNISRMECKGTLSCGITVSANYIGIYPEWNVKTKKPETYASSFHWNISRMECKVPADGTVGVGRSDWNISRMECKVPADGTVGVGRSDWNISRMECKGSRMHKRKKEYLYWNISRMECKVL